MKKDFTSALVPAPGRDLLSEPVLQGLDASSLSKIQTTCSSVQEMKANPSLSVIAHPVFLTLVCQSFQEIDLIKICLARNVQRCRFVGKILHSLSKIQDLNSCSFYSALCSNSNPEISSRSCGSCWSSAL